jgi:hypothetical protein
MNSDDWLSTIFLCLLVAVGITGLIVMIGLFVDDKPETVVSAPVVDQQGRREDYLFCVDALGDKKYCFEKYYK